MKLCSVCWEKKCNHDKGYQREIDDSISDVIIILNKKGYNTTFCCGGHNRVPDEIYISFNKWNCPSAEKFKINHYWKYTAYNSTLRTVTPKNIKTFEQSKSFLEERRRELRNWAKNL